MYNEARPATLKLKPCIERSGFMKGALVRSTVTLMFALLSSLATAQTVINFDDIAGMPPPYGEGIPVAPQYLVSDASLTLGVLFSSAGGGIVVAAAANCVSPPNCASATKISGGAPVMSFSDPVYASFWSDAATAGVVDTVSITLTDTSSTSTLNAYNSVGGLLGSTTGGASATLTLTFPGQIHSVRIDQGPMAFDDFTFDGLAPAPTLAGSATVDVTNKANPPTIKQKGR